MSLEDFVRESIQRSVAKKYHPTVFQRMWQEHGLVPAIKRLVESSEPQSGFRRLKELDLLPWSLEAAVLKFPNEFTEKTIAYATARLDGKLDA